VTFTPESVTKINELHGDAAKASIARVKQSLESSLQFDAKSHPQEKLAKGVVGDNEAGYKAFEETPLQFGSLHLTFNLIAILIVTAVTTILVVGIRESAG